MLYIPVSTIDLAKDQKLYKLPKAKNWEFLGWTQLPKKEGKEIFVVFEVKRQNPSPAPGGWWVDSYYEIGVNPWQGYIKEIPAPSVQ